jgi:uncharacterized protein (TIGR00661 family)
MKIIYGICGIGNGHTYRQEPVIERLLADNHTLCIFAYGNSLAFYQKKYAHHPQVKVIQVAVSFIPGNTEKQLGLDFEMAQHLHHDGANSRFNYNQVKHQDKSHDEKVNNAGSETLDYFDINMQAMGQAQNWLGKPDLCISDYEPISAQYAYAYDAPVITFDQQSKYLSDSRNFPGELGGLSHLDEVMRLNMFFPKVHKRIACSFFDLNHGRDDLLLIAPAISKTFSNTPHEQKHYILYLSSQNGFSQPLSEILELFHQHPDTFFHVFLPEYLLSQLDDIEQHLAQKKEQQLHLTHDIQLTESIHTAINYDNLYNEKPLCQHDNVFFYSHGSTAFSLLLTYCHGVISTAGHTLLSECMAMNIPVYALPINVYEQQLNAWMIHEHGFGIMQESISAQGLCTFIDNCSQFRDNIITDKEHGKNEKKGILLHHPDSLGIVMQEINRFNLI